MAVYVVRSKEATSENFFFGNRNIRWQMVALSLFSTWWFNSLVFYEHPSAIVVFSIVSLGMLVLLSRYGTNIYLFTGSDTVGDYFERRCDSRMCKVAIVVLNLFLSIVLRLTLVLMIGSTLLGFILGSDAFLIVLLLLLIAGIYVIVGGIWTELVGQAVQSAIMVLCCLGSLWWSLGGNILPGFPVTANFELSWQTSIFCVPFVAVWVWFGDQMTVQKITSAGSRRTVQFSSKIAFVIILLVVLCLLFFLVQGTRNVQSAEFQNFENVPWGVRVAVAFLISAGIMGISAGTFNSVALTVTYDFFKVHNHTASGRTFVIVARITAILLLLYAMLIVPFLQSIDLSVLRLLFALFFECAAIGTALFIVTVVLQEVDGTSILSGGGLGAVLVAAQHIVSFVVSEESLKQLGSMKDFEFALVVFGATLATSILFAKRRNALKVKKIDSGIPLNHK